MTGYDLISYFDTSAGFFWPAGQAQIYPELRRMEKDGLLEARVAPRGQHGEKRIYSMTPAGESELRRWASEQNAYLDRDAVRLKCTHLDNASPEAAREYFEAHIAHYALRMKQWEERAENLRSRRAPLLRARLKVRPAREHEAIVEFKAMAFEAQIARAKLEIKWAQRGLAFVDRLLRENGTPKPARRPKAKAKAHA